MAPYEDAMRDVILGEREGTFGIVDISDLRWVEIDFPDDLQKANEEILPTCRTKRETRNPCRDLDRCPVGNFCACRRNTAPDDHLLMHDYMWRSKSGGFGRSYLDRTHVAQKSRRNHVTGSVGTGTKSIPSISSSLMGSHDFDRPDV